MNKSIVLTNRIIDNDPHTLPGLPYFEMLVALISTEPTPEQVHYIRQTAKETGLQLIEDGYEGIDPLEDFREYLNELDYTEEEQVELNARLDEHLGRPVMTDEVSDQLESVILFLEEDDNPYQALVEAVKAGNSDKVKAFFIEEKHLIEEYPDLYEDMQALVRSTLEDVEEFFDSITEREAWVYTLAYVMFVFPEFYIQPSE